MTCPLSFLFLSGSLNKTKVVVGVHVLMAGGTINILALMPFNVGQAYILLIAGRTSASLRAYGGLGVGDGFASVGLAKMQVETRVSKKVPMT